MRFILFIFLLTGCASRDLQWEVASLQAQMAMMNQRLAALEANGGNAKPAVDETAAITLFASASEAFEALEFLTAKALLNELREKYPDSQAARRAGRMAEELAVIGNDAGGYDVNEWIQGSAEPGTDTLTVMVFFEEWCPHCKREVPELEAKSKEWADLDVGVIGFTRLSRSSTLENTTALLNKHKVTYPVGVETGEIADRFNVSGIPAAGITSNGTIVWRGHPARITDELIQALLDQVDDE